jgi:hypothetical protein
MVRPCEDDAVGESWRVSVRSGPGLDGGSAPFAYGPFTLFQLNGWARRKISAIVA